MNTPHDPDEWFVEFQHRHQDAPEVPEWLYNLVQRHRDTPTHLEIGETLRRAHNEGFTQEQLATLMGSYQQNISRWMHYR